MPHRDPTPGEIEAVKALGATRGLMLMAIIFNGEERYAVMAVHQGPAGPYAQLIAVLPTEQDNIVDAAGNVPSNRPPCDPKQVN